MQHHSKISVAALIVISSLLPWSHIQLQTFAQNESVKILIADAIEDLQNGDTNTALTHSNIASQELSSSAENSSSVVPALILLNDAMQDLQNGDIETAQTHLRLASERLDLSNNDTILSAVGPSKVSEKDTKNMTSLRTSIVPNPCPDGNYDGLCDAVSSSVESNTCNDNNFNGICEWYYDIKQHRLIQKQYEAIW